MDPYYEVSHTKLFNKDCRSMDELPDESVDLLVTDPPYGIAFMGKDWDKALPDRRIWAECLRVLKPGAFAFVMSIPRADCLSRMVISLEDARFLVNFTPIFWAYASGFPKAQNIGKAVDKRLGAEREVVGETQWIDGARRKALPKKATVDYAGGWQGTGYGLPVTVPATPQAKALDGSYGGFQPKPAVEVIIVAMKPLSEKTFVDQALKNRKGITWLDDCRVPYESEDKPSGDFGGMDTGIGKPSEHQEYRGCQEANPSGRFPANLLVSDDVLNDGRVTQSGKDAVRRQEGMFVEHHLGGVGNLQIYHPDSGSFFRYFDLDKWWAKTFPFLIVPKASKSEKDRLLDMPRVVKSGLPLRDGSGDYVENVAGDGSQSTRRTKAKNVHPTVKPVKLMSYLITLGSREGDVVLDNFGGSGTTAVAAQLLGRKCIMYEINEAYCEMAANRCRQQVLL